MYSNYAKYQPEKNKTNKLNSANASKEKLILKTGESDLKNHEIKFKI